MISARKEGEGFCWWLCVLGGGAEGMRGEDVEMIGLREEDVVGGWGLANDRSFLPSTPQQTVTWGEGGERGGGTNGNRMESTQGHQTVNCRWGALSSPPSIVLSSSSSDQPTPPVVH